MEEFIIVAVVLAIVLTVVTLVGHGIWVLLSLIFRGARQNVAPTPQTPVIPPICPRCGISLASGSQRCALCGWPLRVRAEKSGPGALHAVRDQIERLGRLELLDPTTCDELLASVMVQEARLAESAKASIDATPILEPIDLTPIETVVNASPSLADPPTLEPSPALTQPLIAPPIPPAPPLTPSSVPLSERAWTYAVHRRAAADPITRDVLTPPIPQPAKQREALSRLLAAFMEEKIFAGANSSAAS